MRTIRTRGLVSTLLASSMLLLLHFPGTRAAAELPDHAHEIGFGSGWECDRGYRKVDNQCEKIVVPRNAYLTDEPYGTGWTCKRGFRGDGDRCVRVEIPSNAYFANTYSGPGWKCIRGYRRANDSCVRVKVPANAHLDYSGSDWECNEPHERSGDRCALESNQLGETG